MKFICPLITVSSIDVARNFYENILDQKVKFDFGENVTFHGDFSIHLRSHFSTLLDHKEIKSGGNNFELYFEYDDVEKMVDRLKEANIDFVHDIREQPWRQKVVRFYDPDQHIIEIGESMEFLAFRLHKEGKALNDIINQIGMPEEFVIASIKSFL
jgi:catechol 2,3-dioxygenase-like lactoylglutathione lyase family enzyme